MAKKSGNGHKGNGSGRTDDLLAQILAELQGHTAELQGLTQIQRGQGRQLTEVVDRLGKLEEETHAGFAELRSELAKTNAGLADLRGEVHEGFAELGSKIVSAVERDRRLEERVAKLEARFPEGR
ncbi:MAG: hypothetical protein ACYDCL_13690 [Myxococcales bacterium]